jgi:hypothetical protein
MRSIKLSMDPKNIMNPGVLLPAPYEHATGQLASIDLATVDDGVMFSGEIDPEPIEAKKPKQSEVPERSSVIGRFWSKKSPVAKNPKLEGNEKELADGTNLGGKYTKRGLTEEGDGA